MHIVESLATGKEALRESFNGPVHEYFANPATSSFSIVSVSLQLASRITMTQAIRQRNVVSGKCCFLFQKVNEGCILEAESLLVKQLRLQSVQDQKPFEAVN